MSLFGSLAHPVTRDPVLFQNAYWDHNNAGVSGTVLESQEPKVLMGHNLPRAHGSIGVFVDIAAFVDNAASRQPA